MKSFFIGLFIVLSTTGYTQNNDQKEILGILKTQTEAWNRGDIDAFMHGYWESDSLKFIGKSGVTYGYKATLARYKKDYYDAAQMGKLAARAIHESLTGEIAQFAGADLTPVEPVRLQHS